MSQKQPVEATVEFLASQHESLPSASEETAAVEPVANSEMPQFAPPTVTGEIGRLGKYRIQKELGRGGMGAVYLAFDERLQRLIALKVMLPKFAANANAKDRFLREARAAARISSDHVVNIFEADEIDATAYIALQLLQGYPLDEYLKKKGLPSLPQIIRIGREMAIGLAAAHKLGLVHRDIKPGNVWLEAPNGRVKILDFGLAKPVEGTDSAELTAMGSLVGTPAYMAPEQGRGQTLDGRADLFSLGCVLYRLCTGKLPFARSTLMSILIAVATEEPTPVRELNPNVPEPLAELIRRLMAKNAADRPVNAQAVVKELDGIIEPTQKSAEVIPHVFYAPMAVSVQESNPFADIDTVMDSETAEPQVEVAKLPPRKFPAILVGSLMFALIAIVLAGFIIIKITNKDGTVTEVKVPKDSKIEVDGKTVTAEPKKLMAPNTPLTATYKNSIGMEFVKVPKGTGWLGGGAGKQGETKVVIEQDFYLGKYEVTQEEWEAVTGQNPSHFSRTGAGKDAVKDIPDADLKRFPVEMVSWDDCQLFIKRLNEKEKDTGWVYRLPKEAEWEYACRGGPVDKWDSAFDFYFAKPTNTLKPEQANYAPAEGKGLQRTCKVGSYEPNSLGLYDMHGNVWQWCEETEKAADGASHRVFQGGSWGDGSVRCRAADRHTSTPSTRLFHLGARLARVPVGPAVAVPATTDPDRKAAEYVQSVGGLLAIRVNEQEVALNSKEKLPTEPFRVIHINLTGTQVTDDAMPYVAGCECLKNFRFDNTKITEKGLLQLRNLKSLIYIQGDVGNGIGNDSLGSLSGNKLIGLILDGSSVDDAGLKMIAEFNGLNNLVLNNSKISDAGLAHLKPIASLVILNVANCNLSDVCIEHLIGLKTLLVMNVSKTRITAAGFEKLKAALPKCRIASDYGTYDPSSTFKNSVGMEFVKVPKGTGWLGGGSGKQGETKVVIEQDFYLGKYEVTQEEWEAVTGLNPSHFSRTGGGKDAVKDIPDADLKRFPVENVSWDDCQLFIKRLNEKEKDAGWVYRLPKEAEWEYACRGGPVDKLDSAFDFYFAKPTNTLKPEQANFEHGKGLKRTCKVDSHEPNVLGLHDMHGNVWEWCEDIEKVVNGAPPRVIRGGSKGDAAEFCRAAFQSMNHPGGSRDGLGLRLARVPVGPAVAAPATTADPEAAQFMEVHGITLDAFKEWAAKLPKGYQPSWISLRSSGEVRFDAVATLVPDSREWKLIFVKRDDDKPYYALKATHRLARCGDYKAGDKFDYFTLGILDNKDGQESSYWYGNADFVGGKIVEGFKLEREHNGVKERWLPYSLVAYNNGESITYQLMSCWQPDVACEWHPELTAEELATKIAEYRKKGWRPHIVSVHSNREDVKFLAVFIENKTNETWDFTPNLRVADYETQLVDRKSKGQRPRCIGSHLTGGIASYTVVWNN